MLGTNSRRRFLLGTAIYMAVLVVVVSGLTLLYRGARERLDQSLGERLTAIATTATYLVDARAIDDWRFDPEETTDFLWLTTRFEQIRRANELAELTLCDPDAFVLISASGQLPRGELNSFWELDPAAIQLARQGFPTASKLYHSGELFQKSAHAPVLDSEGNVVAIVTAEGAADFFDTLATLRRGAVSSGLLVVAFLVLSALAIWRLDRAGDRYRSELSRQQNLAAMGRMTAGIAHEIRNPLGVIRGAGQHVQRRLTEAGIEDPMADFIPEEVDRLDRILTGYLSFGTDAPSEHDVLDLAEVARRTATIMEAELATTGVQLCVELPPLPTEGDRHRLQQLLINLLLNSRDAMPEGGTVTLTGADRDGLCTLTVTDEGIGLEPGAGDELFAAFHTNKEKGSGLGLALSRQIAENHGGTLTLAARTDGRGAVATLVLPRHSPKAG